MAFFVRYVNTLCQHNYVNSDSGEPAAVVLQSIYRKFLAGSHQNIGQTENFDSILYNYHLYTPFQNTAPNLPLLPRHVKRSITLDASFSASPPTAPQAHHRTGTPPLPLPPSAPQAAYHTAKPPTTEASKTKQRPRQAPSVKQLLFSVEPPKHHSKSSRKGKPQPPHCSLSRFQQLQRRSSQLRKRAPASPPPTPAHRTAADSAYSKATLSPEVLPVSFLVFRT